MLVEPLGRGVDVVVCAGVGSADDHDGEVGRGVDAVIVYGGLEEVFVLGDPGRESQYGGYGCLAGVGRA